MSFVCIPFTSKKKHITLLYLVIKTIINALIALIVITKHITNRNTLPEVKESLG